MTRIFLFSLFVLNLSFSQSQITFRLKPDEQKSKDALIESPAIYAGTNFGNGHLLHVAAWTWQGSFGVTETLFDFDWSLLPPNSKVSLANGKFFALNGQDGSQEFHSTIDGNNDSWIEKITSPWDESTVTYTNRPSSTTVNRVYVSGTDSVNQDLEMNLTTLVNEQLQNPGQSHGFLWKLVTPIKYRRVGLCSSNNEDPSKWPEIRLTFKAQGVTGTVISDENDNCASEITEKGLNNRIVEVQPGNYFATTNEVGIWHLDLPVGSYTASYLSSDPNWTSTCNTSFNFTVASLLDSITVPPFMLKSDQVCTAPNIAIYSNILRRCFSAQEIYVTASNSFQASTSLNAAYADITLDPLFTLDSATHDYTALGGNLFRFDLDTLDIDESVGFTLYVTLSCDAVLLETLCHEAKLYPAADCVFDTIITPFPPTVTPCELPWDKSSLKVEGWCANDTVYFTVINHGSGDMDCYAPVRVYLDGELITIDSIRLQSGDSIVYSFAGNGQTWILQADQHPLHPGNSHPNAHVEACGDMNNWIPDIIGDFPQDDADPIVDIFCTVTNGSYDPNDKRGFPAGLTASNFVYPNQEMEYIIRFQNTGTDTAFTVVVRDTLDEDFDIRSISTGTCSHPYTFRMYGPRVLEWRFDDILLVDSTTNEPGSHGFIQFSVKQNRDLPNGTLLTNDADIYFDFNVPVITNNTTHVVNQCLIDQPIKQLRINACDSYTAPNGNVYNASGYYSYSVSNASGCDSLILLNLSIGSSSNPNITVASSDSDLSICDGDMVNFSATAFNGGSAPVYTWKVNGLAVGNGSIFSSDELLDSDIVVCELTSNASCPSQLTAASAPISITVSTVPTISLSSLSSPSVCAGTDGSLGINGTATGTLSWSGTASGSIVTALPANINGLAAGIYNVVFTNACISNSISGNIADPSAPTTPVLSSSGSVSICDGSTLSLSSSVSSNIVWSTGETTSSILITTPGNYYATHTNGACSASSEIVNVSVIPNPAPSVSQSGLTTLCSGESVILTASAADSYLWSNGETTQSITVNSTGNYSVNATNGTCTASSLPVPVTVTTVGVPVILVGGSSILCTGESVDITALSGSNLVWSNGETGNSITVSEAGTYTVSSFIGACEAISLPATIVVHTTPADPVILSNGTNICEGESLILSSSTANGNVWSNGGIDNSITIFTAGTYTVSVTENGCTATSEPKTITSSTPPTVTLSSIGNVCDTAAVFTLNQGLPTGGVYTVNGTVSSSFDPANSITGSNTIVYSYTDGNGCSGEAETTLMVDNCSGLSTIATPEFVLYPNPTQSVIYLQGNFENKLVEIELHDALGRTVLSNKPDDSDYSIDLSAFANGSYTLLLRVDGMESMHQVQLIK